MYSSTVLLFSVRGGAAVVVSVFFPGGRVPYLTSLWADLSIFPCTCRIEWIRSFARHPASRVGGQGGEGRSYSLEGVDRGTYCPYSCNNAKKAPTPPIEK